MTLERAQPEAKRQARSLVSEVSDAVRGSASQTPAHLASALMLQRRLGNRAAGRLLGGQQPAPRALARLLPPPPRRLQRRCASCEADDEPLGLQPRLEIGPVDDPYEREADRVADAVVATRGLDDYFSSPVQPAPEQPVTGVVARFVVQRDCSVPDDEEAEEVLGLQGRFTAAPSGAGTPSLESRIRGIRGSGHTLPSSTRDLMESRLGYDFAGVRVHRDARADDLTRDVNAIAFTVGPDLFFSRGAYQPGTEAGDHLLAHELTHVVQQSTTASLRAKPVSRLQRTASSWDRPGYYNRLVSGQAAHHLIERELQAVNTNLVVEAPIPGAHRLSTGFNKVGYADLYWSTGPGPGDAGKIAGIRGVREGAEARDVWNMDGCGSRRLRHTSPCNQHNGRPRAGGDRGWNPPHLPSAVQLGEIKPASRTLVGAGLYQLSNYERGLNEFADRVRALEPTAAPSQIAVSRLDVQLPPGLDYRRFRSQRTLTSGGAIILGDRRMWVWKGGEGLFLYFDLARDLMQAGLHPEVRQAIAAVEQLKEGLTQRGPGVPGVGRKARATPTGRPGGPPTAAAAAEPRAEERDGDRHRDRHETEPSLLLQRRRPRAARGTSDARKTTWLAEQRALNRSFRGWLRRGAGRDYREKLALDRRLGVAREMEGRAANEEVRDLQSLLFWTGAKGRFVGRMRFFLGDHFERLQGLFDRMRERTRRVRTRFRRLSGGASVGWRARVSRLIISVAREALGTFIGELFALFASCAQNAMDTIIDRFQQEIQDEFATEICQIQERFQEVKDRLEGLWQPFVDDLEAWSETLSDIRWWLDLVLTLEGAIRLAFQVVSCLSPPALGCLWGLVGQLALEIVLDLVVGTQAFHDYVIDPVVERLVQDIFAEPAFAMINNALGPELSEFHCRLPSGRGTARLGVPLPGGMSGAQSLAQRDEWMREHHAEIQAALGELMRNGSGEPATAEQLQELLRAVDGWDPAQIRRHLEGSQRADGTINVSDATRRAGGGPRGAGTTPPRAEDITLPPRRPVEEPRAGIRMEDVVRVDIDPCLTQTTVCSTFTPSGGPLRGVEIRVVPVDAFEEYFRNLGRPQQRDLLDRLDGQLPVLPPTLQQPAGTVPILELRFDLPTP